MIDGNRIGIVGGGQLGRMLTEAAKPLGFEVIVVDPTPDCPASQAGAEQIQAGLKDFQAIEDLADSSDVITWEIEHIDINTLRDAQERGAVVEPSPDTLETIQDKFKQKQFLISHGVPVAPFMPLDTLGQLDEAQAELQDVIVKARFGGYDGRGNAAMKQPNWQDIRDRFGDMPVYAEQIVPFQKELAVISARDRLGNIVTYPVVETIHRNNICHMVLAPAPVPVEQHKTAEEIAHETLRKLDGAGVFAIEMFLTDNDELLVNEIAPRVHNSGHHTIEVNATSQFEQHIRAVSGLPLGSTESRGPAVMINILGDRNGDVSLRGLEKVLALPDVHVHLYGKRPTKVERKMGHITIMAETVEAAKILAEKARKELSI